MGGGVVRRGNVRRIGGGRGGRGATLMNRCDLRKQKFAYETKGTWEVKDDWMGGPFVNYAVRDEKNNRYLILEGFTYAPAVSKRDLQFELESILNSAKIE